MIFGHWRLPWETLKICEVNHARHVNSCCAKISGTMTTDYTFYADTVVTNTRLDTDNGKPLATYPSRDTNRMLLSFRHKVCKDPRDKVFGILGLLEKGSYPASLPDYSLSTAQVFTEAMKHILLRADGDLRCLTGSGFSSGQPGLPSWVRDFARPIGAAALSHEMMRYKSYMLYDAAASTKAEIHFCDPYELHMVGGLIDKIETVGPSLHGIEWKQVWNIFRQWFELAQVRLEEDIAEGELDHRFWSTITGDTIREDMHIHQMAKENDLQVLREWASKLLSAYFHNREPVFEIGVREMFAATYGRAMFSSVKGSLGLCSPESMHGDEIWIVKGSRVPLVLRLDEAEHTYHLLGDCYLDGNMHGEAMMVIKEDHTWNEIILT